MPNMKALAPTVWDKKIFKVFSYGCHSESASPKDHFSEVSLKSVGRFQRRRFISNCSRTDGWTHGRTYLQDGPSWVNLFLF